MREHTGFAEYGDLLNYLRANRIKVGSIDLRLEVDSAYLNFENKES